MVCGRRVRLLIRLMMMLIRARRSCQEPRLHSMMVRRRSVSFQCIPRLRPMDIGSSGSVDWMSLVNCGTIRLAGTCSWAISTRPTTIRRSVISWEHGSRMRPQRAAGGLVFTWPANIDYVPTFAGIDHIVLDSGMLAGRVKSLKIDGSDHRALLATVQFDV